MKNYKITVSAIALASALSASPAFAQSTTTFTNDEIGTSPSVGGAIIPFQDVPGLTSQTNAYVLVDAYGHVITTSTLGAVNSDGTPAKHTYADAAGFSTAVSTDVGHYGILQTGNYLVDSNGNFVTPSAGVNYATSNGNALSGYTWVNASTSDGHITYDWRQVQYADEAGYASAFKSTASATNGYVLTDVNGKMVSAPPSGVTPTTSAANLPAGYSWTKPTTPDGKATTADLSTAAGTDWAYNRVVNGTVSQNTNLNKITNTISTAPGGVLLTNGTSSLKSGSGGIVATDGSGGAATLSPTAIGTTDGKGNTTTITPSTISVVGPNGSVTIADPSIVVTGGGHTTSIVNGTITNDGGTHTTGGTTTDTLSVTNGATVAGGLGVTGGTTTDTLTVTGDSQVNGNQTVNGQTKTGSLVVTGTSQFGGAATFNGGATVNNGLTVNGGSVTNGTATFNNGTVTVGGTKTDTLDVTGDSQVNGNQTVNGQTKTGSLVVTGTSQFGDNSVFNKDVTVVGTTTTGALKVNSGATILGGTNTDTLAVTGNSTVGGNSHVKGNSRVDGNSSSKTATVDSFVGNYYTGGNNEVGFALTSYGQQFATVDSRLAGIDSTLVNHEDRIGSLEDWRTVAKGQLNDLYGRSNKAFEGVAIALAAQQFTLEHDKRVGASANFGTFEGQNALAVSLAARLNQNWQINAGVGFGTNQGTVGGRVGVVGQW